MKDYKLIGFDMDGTLCHPVLPFEEVFERAFGVKLDAVGDIWLGAVMADGVRTGVEAIEVMFPSFTEQQADEYLHNFSGLWARNQKLFVGVEAMLRRLQAEGVQLTLVTNGPSVMQHAVIDHLGIRGYFGHAFTTGDEVLGVNKPNQACFDKVAALMNVAPAECLFVGDGEVNDYKGAMGAGWDALWVKPTNDMNARKFFELVVSDDQASAHAIKWV